MPRWQRIVHDATHSRRILWRFAFAMLALGVAAGYALHAWRPGPPPDVAMRVALSMAKATADTLSATTPFDLDAAVLGPLKAELASTPHPFDEVLELVPLIAEWAPTLEPTRLATTLGVGFTPEQSQLAADLLAAIRGPDAAALRRLQERAGRNEPMPHAAHALGLLHLARDEYKTAYTFFALEGRRDDAVSAREHAVGCLIAAEDFATLRALEADPAYAEHLGPEVRLEAAVDHQDWPAILRLVPESQFSDPDPANTALALVAGCAWAFVLLHLGQVTPARRSTVVLCLLAVVAGVLSTTPTIYAVIWQDDMLGFTPDGDALRSVLYFIGGVGVREEVCKLVLFLPFLPVLLRRDDELEALIVASFVGLGFAMEENGNYFLESGGAAAATRFLTANFFHIVLTGMNGLALHRAFARGGTGIQEFLTVFGATILAHGGYDALLSMPEIGLGGYLAMAVYVVTCQFYFSRVNSLREPMRATVSLSGAFVGAISTLAAAMIIYQIARLGPAAGLEVVLPEFVGTIVLLVMFFREFDEPLTA